jgi:hypothetical protein
MSYSHHRTVPTGCSTFAWLKCVSHARVLALIILVTCIAALAGLPGTSMADGGSSWWDGFADQGLNDCVRCLAVYDDCLVVGGWFTQAGPLSIDHVACWDGTAWAPLGEGLYGTVHALCEYDGDLVAGGWFTRAGETEVTNIARWDGEEWHPLGGGIGGHVLALAVYDGQIVAGGMFREAGGVAADFVASWDGSSWAPLGAGMDGPVFALCNYGQVLVAGGSFAEADSNAAKYIAAWDGNSWTEFGGGTDDWVEALRVFNGDLIAGGFFGRAGATSASNIGRWDGENWNPLGSGMDECVLALGAYEGDLIAGGWFTHAGDWPANCIARWNGESWRSLGSGLGPGPGRTAYALAEYEGSIYVGGQFSTAGIASSSNIGRWDDAPPFLSLAVFQNPYLSQYLDIYLFSTEPLDSKTVSLTVEEEEVALGLIDPRENVWTGNFRIESSKDSVGIMACGEDVLGNQACTTVSFSARLIHASRGGSAVSTDGRLTFKIGAGALSRDTYILISLLAPASPDSGDDGFVYAISPESITLDDEACIEFRYEDQAVGQMVAADQLYIENSDSGPLDCIVDPACRTLYARTKHLGKFRLAIGATGTTPQADPDYLVVGPAFPTPSRGRVSIRFEVRSTENVTVAVYDIEGRRVATLLQEPVRPGTQETRWDGRTSRGDQAPPGVYFCEVRTANRRASSKIVLLP